MKDSNINSALDFVTKITGIFIPQSNCGHLRMSVLITTLKLWYLLDPSIDLVIECSNKYIYTYTPT